MIFFTIAAVGVTCGCLLVWGLNYMAKRRWIKEVEAEASEYIDLAQQSADESFSDLKKQLEEERVIAIEQFENESQSFFDENKQKQLFLKERKNNLVEEMQKYRALLRTQQAQVDRQQDYVKKSRNRLFLLSSKKKGLQAKYKEELKKQFSPEVIQQINESCMQLVEQETRSFLKKELQFEEELAQQNAERNAQAIIHVVLNRFAHAYCPERGVNYVNLSNEKTKNRVFGPNRSHLRQLEEICGVDLFYREDMNSISVSGFDPVRREWALASLKEIRTEQKPLNKQLIAQISHNVKRRLLKKIKRDGRRLFEGLKLHNVDPEITYMMGALRYRYSFAQNQYFHCSEVGFLCGLLAVELGLPLLEARRAGVLHDIGKAMDHSMEGGHAVIGASFIEKYGESSSIVHAVRAHHYDEEPKTNLAFLVIAADALSGARPGARRSTADSYMQKMGQLQEIGNSFEETQDTFIMGAGREVRIRVNSQSVNDRDLIDLSKRVTQKIEDECNYPGFIKVTIVRQTQAVEYAK